MFVRSAPDKMGYQTDAYLCGSIDSAGSKGFREKKNAERKGSCEYWCSGCPMVVQAVAESTYCEIVEIVPDTNG